MKIELDGQTALVTGASRGIGKAIATALGRAGATVIGTATGDKGVQSIQAEFSEQGIQGRGVLLNVAEPASIAALGKALEEADTRPGILINNAGITRDNLMLRMQDEEWEQVINTNLSSIYRLSKLCLRDMMKQRYGRIINITSVVALSGNAGQANYAAAKAGMIGFSRALAKEIGSRGITVNCVAPGFIATDMTAALSEQQQQVLLQQIPAGRLGNAEDIAQAVVFLASPAAAYISGEVININGGMYMA
ncbi:MAG: 3-oxoacyl-ACP reductase FabG [Gammaproteobacteria bacterium]